MSISITIKFNITTPGSKIDYKYSYKYIQKLWLKIQNSPYQLCTWYISIDVYLATNKLPVKQNSIVTQPTISEIQRGIFLPTLCSFFQSSLCRFSKGVCLYTMHFFEQRVSLRDTLIIKSKGMRVTYSNSVSFDNVWLLHQLVAQRGWVANQCFVSFEIT